MMYFGYLSALIFFGGESVMVDVATKMPASAIPMTLSMPHILGDDGAYSLLGLGDIVLPGLFICFNYGFDKSLQRNAATGAIVTEKSTTTKISYFTIALIGYTVGFMMTLGSFMIMTKGQPALLYLVPCTLIPISVVAYFQGHFMQMWRGGLESTTVPTVEDRPLLSLATTSADKIDDEAVFPEAGDDVIVPSVVIDVTTADAIKSAVNNDENV